MRIGVITTSYPRTPEDPAGSFVAGHVAALGALGHAVEVIAAGSYEDVDAYPDHLGEAITTTGHCRAEYPDQTADRDRGDCSVPTARDVGSADRDATGQLRSATAGLDRDDDRRPRAGPPARVTRIGGGALFYRGGAPDALERSPLRAGAAAAAFTARLAATVAVRARSWDMILAHWLVPSALVALPYRVPLLAIAHGGDVFLLRRLGLLAPVLSALRRRDAQLVFVSAELREIARAAAPRLSRWLDGATIQSMGLDVQRFTRLGRAPADPPIVLVVARLVPIKGVDVAIAAMPRVRRAARLVVAGDGPERIRLAARAPDSVIGAVTTTRRDALLRAARVVVIPSRVLASGRTEGTPLIALEALAAGVPVIASAVGGLRALPGVRLVPPDDPVALAAAIEDVLASPPPPAALQAGVAHLDWREVVPHLIRE